MSFPKEAIDSPSILNQALESRVGLEIMTTLGAYAFLRQAPHGDGHPVLVLPGFLTNSVSTALLRRFLKDLGYRAHRWKLGWNTGPVGEIEHAILVRVRELRRRYRRKVSLVGWSLGGVYARELAWMAPEDIRQVITLGSPVRHHAKSSVAWLYAWIADQHPESIGEEHLARANRPPPVPTTCIYSRTDGIVPWQCSIEQCSPTSENIRIESSHFGLGSHPLAFWAIADRLAQPEGDWRPFSRDGVKRWLYGTPDSCPEAVVPVESVVAAPAAVRAQAEARGGDPAGGSRAGGDYQGPSSSGTSGSSSVASDSLR
jgi:pimeloyl-ACP methyl ester carboxylesterase